MRFFLPRAGWALAAAFFLAAPLLAQAPAEPVHSRNVVRLGHLPLDFGADADPRAGRVGAVVVDQDPARPLAYATLRHSPPGLMVLDLRDPAQPRALYTWMLSSDANAMSEDVTYFQYADRTYLVMAYHTPGGNGGAFVFDVTDFPENNRALPRAAHVIAPGGFQRIFAYKHSDGRPLLFGTGGGDVFVYDLAAALGGATAPLARLGTPETLENAAPGFDNVFVAYHPDSEQDRFYGAGASGYYIYDVTDLAAPTLLAEINSAAVQRGQTIVPTPDGRYVVTAASYRLSPLRIFDLQPVYDGTVPRVRTAVGAWTADWRNFSQNFVVRWPYVFVAALHDGLQVVNMRDAGNPYTAGYYRTWTGDLAPLADRDADLMGTWDVDVRNHDGLILVSDRNTGFWTLRDEAFRLWHGHAWGMPHVSNAQDWENGPVGIPDVHN